MLSSISSTGPSTAGSSTVTATILRALASLRTLSSTTTPSTSSAGTSTTSARLISKGEVDVDLLLPVGSLEVDNLLLFLLFALFLVLLLVDGGLLPLGIILLAFTGLPHVELGALLLDLLSLPLIQSHGLGLIVLFGCPILNGLLLVLSLLSLLDGLLHGGVVGFFTIGLDVILEVAPVALAAASSLLLWLDAGP